jgi:ribose 5-phosphate isomerase A
MNQPGKWAAAQKALQIIQPNTIIGLGTGSTVECFIELLYQAKLKIKTVSSSNKTTALAKAKGIEVLPIDTFTEVNLTVDGADEVDLSWNLIKGGGGAHTREKILATHSKEFIVIIDEGKLVSKLGTSKLPVEILPYGVNMTRHTIESLGCITKLREDTTKTFITDNGNYILDLYFPNGIDNPAQINNYLKAIPGVIETGLFIGTATQIMVGKNNGENYLLQKK